MSPRRATPLAALACVLLLARAQAAGDEVPAEDLEPKVVHQMDVQVTLPNGDEEQQHTIPCQILDDEDAAATAFRTCTEDRWNKFFERTDVMVPVAKALEAKIKELDYKPPKDLKLRSAGAHKKRALKHMEANEYTESGADLLRALMRKGLEEPVVKRLKSHMADAFRLHRKQKEQEAVEKAKEAAAEARRLDEEKAAAEARARAAQDEQDWVEWEGKVAQMLGFPTGSPAAEATAGEARKPVVAINLNLVGRDEEAVLSLHHDQDPSRAAYDFCVANSIQNSDEVKKLTGMLREKVAGEDYTEPAELKLGSGMEHMARGQKHMRAGAFAEAGADFARAVDMGEEGAADGIRQMMEMEKTVRTFATKFFAKEWEAALDSMTAIPRGDARYNATVLLMQGRCYQQLGRWANALRAASQAIDKTASYGTWSRGQERMMAVSLGAKATMELGNSEKALKVYKIVLRYDPDQKQTRKQYKALKSFIKVLKDAEEKLKKGRNHDALDLLEKSLSLLRGMEVDSGLVRSSVLLKLCRAQSGMNMHEEALINCELAVAQRSTPVPGLFVNPIKMSEAYRARAEAYMNDKNFAEAVADFREAAKGLGMEEEEEVNQELREAQMKQEEWEDQDRRDHAAVLGLPVNLHELKQDKQCTWLKKQYKKMARRWHPDKAKGNKKRAERKMREMSEAKEVLGGNLGCDGGKRDRERREKAQQERANQQRHHGGGQHW